MFSKPISNPENNSQMGLLELYPGKKPDTASPKGPIINESGVDRWRLLELLVRFRRELSLKDSEVAVIRGLFKCLPRGRLAMGRGLPVQARNRHIQKCADGLPASTFGHALRSLEKRKFIRRDRFGNGKRGHFNGNDRHTLGVSAIDISPLINTTHDIITKVASISREHSMQNELRAAIKRQRWVIRDQIEKIAENSTSAPDGLLQKHLKKARLPRKADSNELQAILQELREDSDALALFLSGTDARFERPIHKSNTEVKYIESSSCEIDARDASGGQTGSGNSASEIRSVDCNQIVLYCPDIRDFLGDRSEVTMANLVYAAEEFCKIIGIKDHLWAQVTAKCSDLSVVLAVCTVLNLQGNIRDHGAYLARILRNLIDGKQNEFQLFRNLQNGSKRINVSEDHPAHLNHTDQNISRP